jgi:diguanylate cyclase
MSLLSQSLVALVLFAPSTALLWVAAARAPAPGARLRECTLPALLAVVGLWWPLQAGVGLAALAGWSAVVWSLALALLALGLVLTASLSSTLAGPLRSHKRIAMAGSCVITAALALGLLAPPSGAGVTAALLLGAVLWSGSLAALAHPRSAGWPRRRLSAALLAALVPALMPALTGNPTPAPGLQPALWPMLALVAVVAMSHGWRRHAPGVSAAGFDARRPERAPESMQDPLTLLPTRVHFEQQLAAAVVDSDARGASLALLFIDLDGFKPVNDTYGHGCGDLVLARVGERLRSCARSGDVVARVGGDEFLMLMKDTTDQKVAERARRVVETLSEDCEVEGRHVSISCSIGIAMYPLHGQHAKLVARADAAMYAAKRAGGAGFTFFSPALEDDARERFELLRELRHALERDELELYYQPKIDAATGKVTAAEALIRWNHPKRGLLGPDAFMAIAERFGLIRRLGHWVIEEACRQAGVWRESGLRMRVAINLSALQMRQDDLVERIQGSLARHHVDPRLLTCEITESVAMEDTRVTQGTLRALGAAGIHVSIDDFGTGYSSLAYLRKLPAEELKIDRSFIMDVEFSADARAVVDAVLKLSHALGLKVVAEGIENERQQRILTALGCDELQGFLFAKPMTARALLLWALDDRDSETQSFATSLFTPTAVQESAFATTSPEPAGDLTRPTPEPSTMQ